MYFYIISTGSMGRYTIYDFTHTSATTSHSFSIRGSAGNGASTVASPSSSSTKRSSISSTLMPPTRRIPLTVGRYVSSNVCDAHTFSRSSIASGTSDASLSIELSVASDAMRLCPVLECEPPCRGAGAGRRSGGRNTVHVPRKRTPSDGTGVPSWPASRSSGGGRSYTRPKPAPGASGVAPPSDTPSTASMSGCMRRGEATRRRCASVS